VRETLDFAARVQGVGHKEEELRRLIEREEAAGVEADPEVDAFVKVHSAAIPTDCSEHMLLRSSEVGPLPASGAVHPVQELSRSDSWEIMARTPARQGRRHALL
jgi:hypothetical protein